MCIFCINALQIPYQELNKREGLRINAGGNDMLLWSNCNHTSEITMTKEVTGHVGQKQN